MEAVGQACSLVSGWHRPGVSGLSVRLFLTLSAGSLPWVLWGKAVFPPQECQTLGASRALPEAPWDPQRAPGRAVGPERAGKPRWPGLPG